MKGIGFENFKVFENLTNFDFCPLTFLIGTNNSGKSSLLNGLKLLSENFKNIDLDENNPKLNEILNHEYSTNNLLERHGDLTKYINNKTNKNEFRYTFSELLENNNDTLNFEITIKLRNTNLNTGNIKSIIVNSTKFQEQVFSVKRNESNNYSVNINFIYFYKALINQISFSINYKNDIEKTISKLTNFLNKTEIENIQNDLNEINRKYNTSLILIPLNENYDIIDAPWENENDIIFNDKELESLKYYYNRKTAFDFSYLWMNNDKFKSEFNLILSNYNSVNNKSKTEILSEDIFNFLSSINWSSGNIHDLQSNEHNIDFFLTTVKYNSKTNIGFSINKFFDLFTNFKENTFHIESSKNLIINEEIISQSIEKYNYFYTQILKPLLELIYEASKKETKSLFDHNNTIIVANLESLSIGFFEIKMTNILHNVISKIHEFHKNISETKFLSNERIHFSRSYSFNGKDDFNVLVKKLEGLPKYAYKESFEFINKWLKIFEIADELSIDIDPDVGNFRPFIVKDGYKMLLADYGYGTSRLLPLILLLTPEINLNEIPDPDYIKYTPRTIAIEEPESNLHPALQSKLADLFAEVQTKYNTQLIVETHSEYLIRKLQFLTKTGVLSSKQSVIHYFHPPKKDTPGWQQVRAIKISEEDGSLSSDFGPGFFDEADNIAMSLWSLNHGQKN